MYKIGTNQYKKKKPFVHTHKFTVLVFGSFMLCIFFLGLITRKEAIEQTWASEKIISPVVTSTPTPTPTQTPEQVKEQSEIEAYIKTIFGKDAKTAIAVSRNECSPHNKQYPRCQFHTDQENSIGLFQINLASKSAKVHYDRVPGETLEEKIEWLKQPKNNVLMAYWIFQKSGFNPWTAYTSGNYLKDM